MFVVDSIGKSRGLALLWGEETNVTIQNFSQHHINGMTKILENACVGFTTPSSTLAPCFMALFGRL
jgi:hypothetical protein